MSVNKRANGKWEVRYRDRSGSNRAKSFTIKKDAEKYEREQKIALERGDWTNPDKANTTISELFNEFFKLKVHLKPKARETILSHWRFHVEPKFGKSKVGSITSESIIK